MSTNLGIITEVPVDGPESPSAPLDAKFDDWSATPVQIFSTFLDRYSQGLFPGNVTPAVPTDLLGDPVSEGSTDPCFSSASLSREESAKQFYRTRGFLPAPKTVAGDLERGRTLTVQRFNLDKPATWKNIHRCARLANAFFKAPIAITTADRNGDTVLTMVNFQASTESCEPKVWAESLVSAWVDTKDDWRFSSTPGAPRAYIGQPLLLPVYDGGVLIPVGVLSILTPNPRVPMTRDSRAILSDLAGMITSELQRAWHESRQGREQHMRGVVSDLLPQAVVQASTVFYPVSDNIFSEATGFNFSGENPPFSVQSPRPAAAVPKLPAINVLMQTAAKNLCTTLDSDFACILDISAFHLTWEFDNASRLFNSKFTWIGHGGTGSSHAALDTADDKEQIKIWGADVSERCHDSDWEKNLASPSAMGALAAFLRDYTQSAEPIFLHPDDDSRLYALLPSGSRAHIAIPVFHASQPTLMVLVSTQTPFQTYEPADISFATNVAVVCLGSVIKSRLVAADAAKTAFVSMISHELRTPLHGLLSQLELIQEFATADHLSEMGSFLNLNDVLDFGKLEMSAQDVGGLESSKRYESKTDLALLASEVLNVSYGRRRQWNSVTEDAGQGGVEVSVYIEDVPSGWWALVILLNIGSNALKYTPSGTITLYVRMKHGPISPKLAEKGFRYIEYIMKDTGIGMSDDFKQNLFTPFVQANTFSDLNRTLMLVAGQIRVASEIGKGTTVTITLLLKFIAPGPVRSSTDPSLTFTRKLISEDYTKRPFEGMVPATSSSPGAFHLSKTNDEESIPNPPCIGRKILTTLLIRRGIPFVVAVDGLEALAKFREFRPHLVWTDVSMPKELFLPPARIIAITGMSSQRDMKAGLLGEAALDEWLVKGQTNLKTLSSGLEKLQQSLAQSAQR
ncbi:hypothetical protein B0H10DRAFT_2037959 [Mycena sp. CBHHK59/15]|nr:hypothetical protein B0H10DRAFT_2037959 [Mycena sp. CBHHK59/15]